MARNRTFVRGGRARRETLWIAGLFGRDTLASASTAVLAASLNAASLALRPFTIVRVRGVLRLMSDQDAITEDQVAAYGMAVVSDQSAAIGVTAVPTPAADMGSDLWFVYEALINRVFFRSDTGVSTDPGTFVQFDSKAMRKVNNDQDVVVMKESDAISDGCILSDQFRMLVKLH